MAGFDRTRSNAMLYIQNHTLKCAGKIGSLWQFTPPKNYDAWLFWTRLTDCSASFDFRKKVGVFPVVYLRGTCGMFMAVTNTLEELAAIRETVDEVRYACTMNKRVCW